MPKGSALSKLNCYIDCNGVLRVGGRLEFADICQREKHPYVLPKSSHVSQLVIAFCHESVHHQGKGMTVNEVRNQGF